MNARSLIGRLTTPLWPAVVVGIVLGALIGAAVAGGTSTSQVTALIRVQTPINPDQILLNANSTPSTEETQSYLSGEVAYLASPGFTDAVNQRLGDNSAPEVTATQDATSSVVTLQTHSSDENLAKRTLAAAIDIYNDHVKKQVTDNTQAVIASIDKVLAQNPGADRVQLDQQQLSLRVQADSATGAQVIQSPATVSGSSSNWLLGVIAGAVLGGLVFLAIALGLRRALGLVTGRGALRGLVDDGVADRVVSPTVSTKADGDADLTAARRLYAQLPGPRSGRIVVVGSSLLSGSAEVAALIATAAAEHGSVTRIDPTGDALDDDDHQADEQAEVTVVNAGAPGESAQITDAVARADQLVVVVRLASDTVGDTCAAGNLRPASSTPVSLVPTRNR